KTAAPPSFKSSRATAVMTTCFKPIISTDSATLSGSSQSNSLGSPVLTAQKRHPRVHVSPNIINVAVCLSLQHSCRLGHLASSQTVFSRFLRFNFFKFLYESDVLILIFNQSGFRKISSFLAIYTLSLFLWCIFQLSVLYFVRAKWSTNCHCSSFSSIGSKRT